MRLLSPLGAAARNIITIFAIILGLNGLAHAQDNPRVSLVTTKGAIEIELLPKLAPKHVANFLNLVDEEFYVGLVFHRVIPNFMIQAGGYDSDLNYKSSENRVENESFNGLKNKRFTLAMARLEDPDSADTQFFINVRDNPHLDPQQDSPGYSVFGRVVDGLEVIESIELVDTHMRMGMVAVPEESIVILATELL